MSDLNRVLLIGRVGRDPEIRTTTDGMFVASFSIATGEVWYTKDKEKQEKTTWHNIVCFRKTAEFVEQYVHKGALVFIEGKIDIRDYDGKDGEKKRSFQIVAQTVNKLIWDKVEGEKKKKREPGDDEDFFPDEEDVPL
jgi:single-strand DNA-binding protein